MNAKRIAAIVVCVAVWCAPPVTSVKACGCVWPPPGNCCQCENGVWVCQCSSAANCGTCWKCEYRCCVSCVCWSTYTGISGSISTTWDAYTICDIVSLGGEFQDVDRGVPGYGEIQDVNDGKTYAWSRDPAVGVWLDPPTTLFLDWEAPPCTGSVTFTLKVDDVAAAPSGACVGHADVNDQAIYPQKTLSVVLPEGCSEGEEYVYASWTPVELDCNSPSTHCGDTELLGAGCGNYQAVYHDSTCAWEPQFDIHTEIASGVCTNRFQDWDCSNPGLVNASNYCDLAEYFYGIDPCDPGPSGDGCPLTNPSLLPVTDADCIAIHEATHRNEWHDIFFGLEAYCEEQGWLDPIPIDCDDPSTISCRSAAWLFESRIDTPLTEYMGAMADDIGYPTTGEFRAREAAEWCFQLAGGDVCECARQKGWYNQNPCAICPP